MLYFLLHDAERWQRDLVPLLTSAWRARSFAPCRELHHLLHAEIRAFHDTIGRTSEDTLIEKAPGLSFDRTLWRELVGEVLWFGAAETPNFQTEPDLLCCLLAPERYRAGDGPRESWAAIEQAHFGSRDLRLGGYYRAGQSGWNDAADVARLRAALAAIDGGNWSVADLLHYREALDDAERLEVLDDARGALGRLVEMYGQAQTRGQVVICEEV
ncbi:MAG: hypothetical protein JNM56_17700 [Planctomycetia bacterium]|nr:hypothetical protein [Planctomycetia bacterium]